MLDKRASSNSSGVISIPPSQYLEGADGSWSTFTVQVGTPGQDVRLLPGTSATAADTTWVIIDQGCSSLNSNLSGCASKRGNLFYRNESSTWSTQRLPNGGLYSLSLYEEAYLGYGVSYPDNGYYGFDTIELGLPGSGTPTLQNQLIAGIATNDFFLGSLGLSPIPFNFTSFNNPIPSILGTLKNQSLVNSTTWAYTAGAAWLDPPVFGSLTFGGLDSTRQNGSSIQVPFYKDQSRDLLVGLQTITYDSLGSTPLMSTGIYAFMDSLVAQMYLPVDVCTQFEKAFGLTYDSTTGYYLLSDSQHSKLISQNPTFTFTLGAETSGGSTTQIKLPYASLDLNITAPYVNSTQRYFPLQRATNSSQYTLGRAFFQGAYVVANYDQQTFNVSQAAYPSSNAAVNLVPVQANGVIGAVGSANSTGSSSSSNTSQGISGGAIAGIVIGVIAALAILAGIIIWFFLRKRKQKRGGAAGSPPVEADSAQKNELEASEAKGMGKTGPMGAELDTSGAAIHEMQAENKGAELPATQTGAELPGESRASKFHEMYHDEKPQELANTEPEQRWELPG